MNKGLIFFYMYRIFSRSYFHLSVLFVYFYLKNIPLLQIEVILAIYGTMLIISAKWNALLSKKIKQKYVIAIGEAVKAVGLACFILTTNIWVLIIGQVLSGIGYSFTAGTDASLLRSMFMNQISDSYKKVEASSNSYMFISFLLSGIIGSIIFRWNHNYVFYLSIGANVLSIVSILFIREKNEIISPVKDTGKQEAEAHNIQKNLFWKNYYALSRAFSQAIFVGFLPYLFFVTIKVNLYYFGLILSLFTLAGYFSARYIILISKKIDARKLPVWTASISILSIILFGFSQSYILSIIAITLLGLSQGGVRPLTLSNLDTSHMNINQRTVFFSSMEKLYGFWNVFLLIGGGFLFYIEDFQKIMFSFSVLYFVLAVFIFQKHRISKVPNVTSVESQLNNNDRRVER